MVSVIVTMMMIMMLMMMLDPRALERGNDGGVQEFWVQ